MFAVATHPMCLYDDRMEFDLVPNRMHWHPCVVDCIRSLTDECMVSTCLNFFYAFRGLNKLI